MKDKYIHQILITDNEYALPPLIREQANNTKQSFPNYIYTLHTKQTLIDFIKKEFDNEIYQAFNKLKPYSYKADLAKYCLAYSKGGWYVDITIKLLSNIESTHDLEFIGFQDLGGGKERPNQLPYSIQSSLFYAKPRNKIFEKAIEIILENCKSEYYGMSPICPTGPGVLGRAFAHVGYKQSHLIGNFMPLTPFHQQMNRSYILPNGNILALHKDAWMPKSKGGDISSFGIQGSNNYLSMYLDNDIYN